LPVPPENATSLPAGTSGFPVYASVSLQLDRLRTTVAAQDFDPAENARLDQLARLVEQALAGR